MRRTKTYLNFLIKESWVATLINSKIVPLCGNLLFTVSFFDTVFTAPIMFPFAASQPSVSKFKRSMGGILRKECQRTREALDVNCSLHPYKEDTGRTYPSWIRLNENDTISTRTNHIKLKPRAWFACHVIHCVVLAVIAVFSIAATCSKRL